MQPPFIGPSYNLESRPAGVQRTVNMVPVPIEPGNERAGWGFDDVPGLVELGLSLCFVETFDEGLDPYTTVNGNTSIFEVSARRLTVDAQNGGSAYIQRSIPTLNGPVKTWSGLVKVTALANDDSCGVYLVNELGSIVIGFVPRAAIGLDPLQRPSADFQVGSAALLADLWHRFEFRFAPGSGNSSIVITRVNDGSVVASQTLVGSVPPFTAASLRFFIDSTTLTAATEYDTIIVCPH